MYCNKEKKHINLHQSVTLTSYSQHRLQTLNSTDHDKTPHQFRYICLYLSDAARDLATLTFDLGGHGAWRWCRSLHSICIPSFKFIDLSVWKIWCTSSLSISQPSGLWPWNWCTAHYCRGVGNFVVSRTFCSRPIGQYLSDASHDLVTFTFDLGGHSACRWYGSLRTICVPSLKFIRLPVRKILYINCVSINRPGDLDLWPLNRFTAYSRDELPSCQCWAF